MGKTSEKVIINRIDEAIAAIEAESFVVIDDRHDEEAMELCGVTSMDEVFTYVLAFLKEIKAIGPLNCFARRNLTVEKSYHEGFKEIELFGYVWDSELVGQRVYLKFGVKNPVNVIRSCY